MTASTSARISGEYEVIIVGAGPTGVLAAHLLGGSGVRTLLIDCEEDILPIPRAVGICEEGSRILDSAGLLNDCISKYLPINSVHFVDENLQSQFHFDADWRKDGYKAIRMFHQPDLERELRSTLSRYPHVDFKMATEMRSFTDMGASVEVRLRQKNEAEPVTVTCRYLVGCDGAKSPVRKILDIGFRGSTYPQDWVILDIENSPLGGRDVAFSINPKRPSVTMPGPGGRRRWEFVVKRDDDVEKIFHEDNIRHLLAPWGDMSQATIARQAVYTFHARTAANYQKGNVFLLGDAAHITPPFAGQGMMAGLRDANNLCWKLAAVLQGRVGDSVLKSYEVERIPQSKQIIGFAQFMGSIILPQRKLAASLRDGVFKLLGVLGVHSEKEGIPMRKLPNHINGSLLRHTLISAIKKTGIELPQFPLDTPSGQHAPSDKLLGSHFRVLGWNLDPAKFLQESTFLRWSAVGGEMSTLTSCENFDTGTDVLLDRCQKFRETFSSGKRVLVIRPDKMIVINCKPAALDRALNDYLDTIECVSAA